MPVRYLIDRHIQQRYATVFPFGTLAVNIADSLLLGLLRLLEDGSVIEAGVNAVGSVLLGALAAFASYSMASIAG